MSNDYYAFDKRRIKKIFIKYGIIFLICIPILICVNLVLNKYMEFGIVVAIDVALAFGIIVVSEIFINKIKELRAQKEEQKRIDMEKQIEEDKINEIIINKQNATKNKKGKNK